MTFAYAPLNLFAEMPEDTVTSLILEQPKLFYEFVSDIYAQSCGLSGTACFSDLNAAFSISKNAVLITQLIPFEMNQKPLLNALYTRMKKLSQEKELYLSSHELSGKIDTFINSLTEQCEEELVWDHLEDITALLKAVSLRFYEEQPDLPSQFLDYMLACREYLGKQLFITVNLRSYLGQSEAASLFHSIVLHKLSVLCIENREYSRVRDEKCIIVDQDYCVI